MAVLSTTCYSQHRRCTCGAPPNPCRLRCNRNSQYTSLITAAQPRSPTPAFSSGPTSLEDDALAMLHWQSVQRSVRKHTSTPQGRSVCISSNSNAQSAAALTPAGSIDQAHALLQQTRSMVRMCKESTANSNDDAAPFGSCTPALQFQGVRDVANAVTQCRKYRSKASHSPDFNDSTAFTLPGAVLIELASTVSAMHTAAAAVAHEPAFSSVHASLNATVPNSVSNAVFESLESPRGSVRDEATDTLAATRAWRRMESTSLREELKAESQRLAARNATEQGTVVERHNRMCLPVRRGRQDLMPGCIVLEESARGGTLYVEPAHAVDRNNKLLELAARERDEEHRILASLTAEFASYIHELENALDALTELDLAQARALHAIWLGAVEPHLHDDTSQYQKISLEQAYNPTLLMQYLPEPDSPRIKRGVTCKMDYKGQVMLRDILAQYEDENDKDDQLLLSDSQDIPHFDQRGCPVPIDFKVPAGAHAVAITGPNTGGKTAALKTVGTIALLAKSGMFVPAEHAELLFPDAIGADIGDAQELEEGLSTFSGHLERLNRIVQQSNENCMLLLDEPGSGTDSADGSALACAVLEHLASKCSVTIATSHYQEVKELAMSHPQFVSAAVELHPNELAPTYELLWHRSGTSDAFQIARRLGMPQEVIDQAEAAMPLLDPNNLSIEHMRASQKSVADAAAERALAAEEENTTLRAQLEEAESTEMSPESHEQDVEADRIQRRAIDELQACGQMESSREEIQEKIDTVVARARMDLGVDSVARNEAHEAPYSNSTVPALCIGDIVLVGRLGWAEARVTDMKPSAKGGQEIDIRAGNIHARVHSNEVKLRRRKQDDESQRQSTEGVRSSTIQEFSTNADENFLAVPSDTNTVDLRGSSPNETASQTRSFLDSYDGSILYIVHGKGSGALRQAVRREVERHPRVLQYRSGDEREGGEGCTVIMLTS